MKTTKTILAASLILCCSCDMLQPDRDANAESGFLSISFSDEFGSLVRSSTKAQTSIPDTNDFILTVTNSDGTAIYSGKYGAAPESIIASPGTYTIDMVSRTFKEPLFDAPQYGDTRTATVIAGSTTSVRMTCEQINSGIRLNVDPEFLTSYPDGVLYLKSSEGRLMYGYSEKRIAYFLPGAVTLQLYDGTQTKSLFTRQLSPKQILQVNVSVGTTSSGGSSAKGHITVSVDTCRYWTVENYEIGSSDEGGNDTSNALSVSQARSSCGSTDVWVYGYIVGGDLSSSQCSFDAPFSSKTNLVLAGKSSCRDKEICLSVQLSKGDIREELNLVDNPGNLGRQIYLKGDIVDAYYGIPGLQCISEYKWK